jgi:hypothetical protein
VRRVAWDLHQSNGDTTGAQRPREVYERVDMSHDAAMTTRIFDSRELPSRVCDVSLSHRLRYYGR